MYSNYFRYVCEDCGIRETCSRGDIMAIRKFHTVHAGHHTHVNDFTEEGPTLEEFLQSFEKEVKDEERFQKFIKVITLGLRGETIADRQRKKGERQRNYE